MGGHAGYAVDRLATFASTCFDDRSATEISTSRPYPTLQTRTQPIAPASSPAKNKFAVGVSTVTPVARWGGESNTRLWLILWRTPLNEPAVGSRHTTP